jgi:hypothetical protein
MLEQVLAFADDNVCGIPLYTGSVVVPNFKACAVVPNVKVAGASLNLM